MSKISLENVSKRWGDFYGAKTINLAIKNKEFVVFLGPSGCGKTTTMRLIAGLEKPTEGSIYLDDRDVTHLEPKDRDIAMVFQSYGLYAHLDVYENIRFPLRVRKVDKSQHNDRVMKAAQMVKLVDFLHRKPKELSGGQRQRVALARAIVRSPNCFLMDEPLSNLDAKLRSSMRAEIKNLQKSLATTTVYVTHDQVEAMTMADRVAVMRSGEIVQLDTPDAIYERPANTYVASFIGSPPMNLVRGDVHGGNFKAEGCSLALNKTGKVRSKNGEKENSSLYLGVRAEDLTLGSVKSSTIKGTVYNTEMMGNTIQVTVKVGEQMVTAVCEKHTRVRLKEKVGLNIKANKFLLYRGEGAGELLHTSGRV